MKCRRDGVHEGDGYGVGIKEGGVAMCNLLNWCGLVD